MSDNEETGTLKISDDAIPAEPDTSVREDVDIQCLKGGLKFYLLKIPDNVVQLVQTSGGCVRFSQHVDEETGKIAKEELSILLPDPKRKEMVECPVAFTDPPTDDRPFVVMSHTEQRTGWKAEGTINKRGVVTPPTTASFGSIHKHDSDKVVRTTAPVSSQGDSILGKRKELSFPKGNQPRKMQTVARSTLSKSELDIKLRTLFSAEKPQWTLTELQKATQQPLQHLKDAMKDICAFNPSSKSYELKSEYCI